MPRGVYERRFPPHNKGKTFEESYGERAAEIKAQISSRMSGENSPSWKGGVYSQFRGEGWDKIRLVALERDNNTCRGCGKQGVRLDVHHIVPWEETQDNSLENLLSLCVSCHQNTHGRVVGGDGKYQRKEVPVAPQSH